LKIQRINEVTKGPNVGLGISNTRGKCVNALA